VQSGVLNGGTSMAIGNVDNDLALEIVTSDGFVFDGANHQNQWAYGPGFGSIIDVGDVNGDGVGRYSVWTRLPAWSRYSARR